jgi:glycosyl transferase family 25
MNLLPHSNKVLACYLINLASAVDRLREMNKKVAFAGLECELVIAIDGKKIDPDMPLFCATSYKFLHGRRPIPAEIGCYLSHIECAKRFLETKADFAMILEDDVSFSDDFMEIIDEACKNSNLWDILRLTSVSNGKKFCVKKITKQHYLAVALTREKGAGAYVINRNAGRWLTKKLIPMRLSYDIAFDLEYLAGLKAAFVWPLPASQRSNYETQIQININDYKLPRYRYFTVLPYRAYLEITRAVCRSYRLIQSLAKGAIN